MDIVIIENFCGDFSDSDNGRFLYLANMLVKRGHTVELVTSSFCHGTKKQRDFIPEDRWPFRITFLPEPGYPKNVCLQRFYSHFVWGKNVGKYLKSRPMPDVLYCGVPSLTGPLKASAYCRKHSVKLVLDVQDLWPEAFEMVFHVPILSYLIFAPFRILANAIYRRADEIVAVSQTYADRAMRVNSKCPQATVAFLGTELAAFDRMAEKSCRKNDGAVRLVYVGTLGSSYDLTAVIKAMAFLKQQGKCEHLEFTVMGDGPLADRFKMQAEEYEVSVRFLGALPYTEMVAELCACDIAMNPIRSGSAGSIINKVGDYAAAGLPVVNTQECLEYVNLLCDYKAGIHCANGDIEAMASAIERLYNDAELRQKMGHNNRRLAEERFDRAVAYPKIACRIEEM